MTEEVEVSLAEKTLANGRREVIVAASGEDSSATPDSHPRRER